MIRSRFQIKGHSTALDGFRQTKTTLGGQSGEGEEDSPGGEEPLRERGRRPLVDDPHGHDDALDTDEDPSYHHLSLGNFYERKSHTWEKVDKKRGFLVRILFLLPARILAIRLVLVSRAE